MPRGDLLRRPQPFLGLLLVSAGWALSHQLGSDTLFHDCAAGGGFVVFASLLGLLIVAVGGVYSLSASRVSDQPGRRALGLISALLSLIAGFAILLQLAAGVILPPCAI